MKTAIFFMGLFVAASAAVISADVDTEVDVGLRTRLKARSHTMQKVFGSYVTYQSFDASVDAAKVGSASTDGLIILAGGDTTVAPGAYMVYFSARADWESKMNVLENAQGDLSVGLQGSAGASVHVYHSIQEMTSTGETVKDDDGKDKIAYLAGFDWKISEPTEDGPLLKTTITNEPCSLLENLLLDVCYGNNDQYAAVSVSIDMVATKELAQLSTGVLLSPKAMEEVVTIEGWPYSDQSNHLVLRSLVGAASAMGSLSSSGTAVLGEGEGDGQVYMNFAKTVNADGQDVNVDVEALDFKANSEGKVDVGIDFELASLDNDILKLALTAIVDGQAEANLKLVKVHFPAAASKIVYDPTYGMGENPEGGLSPGSFFGPQGLIVALLSLTALQLM